MNPLTTRPPVATKFASQLAGLALLAGSAACNAPERAHPPRDTASAALSAPSLSSSLPVPVPVPASPSPSPPSSHPRYVVAAIGDSLTDPRSHGGGYLEYVKARCPSIEVDNFGKGGTMVNQMRRSFEQQVAQSEKHYTHLVVFGGVNDLYSDLTAFRTPAKIEADLSYMYGWGKQHGVTVVAITVAPWGGFKQYFNASRSAATRELNTWISEQPAQGRVDQVVDAFALLSCGDPDSLCDRFFKPFNDGIHFGPEGHQLLGQALFRQAFSGCE